MSEIHIQSHEDTLPVKKCSRCRVKRNENEQDLQRYATCASCRAKRKIERTPSQPIPNSSSANSNNVYSNYDEFLEKLKLNSHLDILDHKFISSTPTHLFKRYTIDEVTLDSYKIVYKQLMNSYIKPLMDVTGFRFPVRDYHKGGSKTRKISFMFICSQDRAKQRKSRSNDKRNIQNKLKVHDCQSKINLNYDLVGGKIILVFNHLHHEPYMWKKERSHKYDHGLTHHQQLQQQQQQQQHYEALSLGSSSNGNSHASSLNSNDMANINFYQATAVELTNLNNYIKANDDQLSLPLMDNDLNVDNIDHELIRESFEMDKKKMGL